MKSEAMKSEAMKSEAMKSEAMKSEAMKSEAMKRLGSLTQGRFCPNSVILSEAKNLYAQSRDSSLHSE
jgi:hypothetical protein